MKILLVDDDPDICNLVKFGLEREYGYQVDIFTDPTVALEHFKPGTYDILILDMRMPKLTGYQLYEKIRDIEHIRTCFFTAYEINQSELKEAFPELVKKFCFIQKPISIEELNKHLT